jgi:hypothetical protein
MITGPRLSGNVKPSTIQNLYNEQDELANIGLNISDPIKQNKYFEKLAETNPFFDANRPLNQYLNQKSSQTIREIKDPSQLVWDSSSKDPPPYYWDIKPPSIEILPNQFHDHPNYATQMWEGRRAQDRYHRNLENRRIIDNANRRYRDSDPRSGEEIMQQWQRFDNK